MDRGNVPVKRQDGSNREVQKLCAGEYEVVYPLAKRDYILTE
jgi:hypothetical protein